MEMVASCVKTFDQDQALFPEIARNQEIKETNLQKSDSETYTQTIEIQKVIHEVIAQSSHDKL